jgi:hypothetical protein
MKPLASGLVACALALAACSADDETPPGALHLELADGNGQVVGAEDVSEPLTVRALDQNDVPVVGVEVTWSVIGGHGIVAPATDTTGVNGTSSAIYHATTEAGPDTIIAHLEGVDDVQFVVQVTSAPGPDRLIFRLGGNGQTLAPNDTSILISLVVFDTAHAAIPGVVVTWSVDSGPGSVIVADTTDAAGLAATRYFSTADTGTRFVRAEIGPDTLRYALRVLPPCTISTLALGQVIDSTLAGGPCPHGEFAMTLAAGQAYFISETHHPDPTHGNVDFVDPVMTFWQALDPRPVRFDRSRFLAFSDDENGELNSAIFFVAPESGTFRILAGSFANTGFGGYRLTLEGCPVIAATADTGTQTYALPPIPAGTCLRDRVGGGVGYRFLTFPIAAEEEVNITVTSADFTPVWESFTNWDPYETGQGIAAGNGVTRLVSASETGVATIAIAGTTEAATGNFTVTLVRHIP